MAKKPTPAPVSKEVAVNAEVIASDFSAANALALIARETEARTRAVATQLGYQLPADCTDPDLIQRDIAANMRRSVEACLEVGRGLAVLKAACQHGQFLSRLDALGIDSKVAARFMQSAVKFANVATSRHLTDAIGSQSKLFEMLVLDDEQIEELELTGQTGELSLDDIATMSVKELRAALREERQERQADQQLLEKKNAKIDQLERDKKRIAKLAPDEELQALMAEATSITRDAMGAIRGGVRAALIALKNHTDDNAVLMAGLVGQIQADLNALRQEFDLPDVSNAADAQLASEVAQWAGK